MTRLFYIIPIVLFFPACSSNAPIGYNGVAGNDSLAYVMLMQREEVVNAMFPVENDTTTAVEEYSYSFVRYYVDSTVWEEGVVRMP